MTLWLLTCTRQVAHNGSEERLHVLLDQANFSSASLLQQLHMSILGQGRTPTQVGLSAVPQPEGSQEWLLFPIILSEDLHLHAIVQPCILDLSAHCLVSAHFGQPTLQSWCITCHGVTINGCSDFYPPRLCRLLHLAEMFSHSDPLDACKLVCKGPECPKCV